jgi:hypothetical protein
MTPLEIREEPKDEDTVQQWGGKTCWAVYPEAGEAPVAAFNSEHSALNYVLREEFRT